MLQRFKGQFCLIFTQGRGKLVNFDRDVTMQITTFKYATGYSPVSRKRFSVSEKFGCNLIGLRSEKNIDDQQNSLENLLCLLKKRLLITRFLRRFIT